VRGKRRSRADKGRGRGARRAPRAPLSRAAARVRGSCGAQHSGLVALATILLRKTAADSGGGEGLDVHLELLSLSSCSCAWIPWRSALRTGGSSHHPSSHNCSVVICSTCFVCAGLLCVVGRDGGEGEGRHGEGNTLQYTVQRRSILKNKSAKNTTRQSRDCMYSLGRVSERPRNL